MARGNNQAAPDAAKQPAKADTADTQNKAEEKPNVYNDGPINVEATKKGYFGKIRLPGDKFTIPYSRAFSKNWMKKISSNQAAEDKTAKASASDGGGGSTGNQDVI